MTLNDQITQKAKQSRQEAETFETSLAVQFRELENKSEDNVKLITKQVDILKDTTEKENRIANEVAIISSLVSKNGLLENLVYAKIQEKLSAFPKKTEEIEIKEPTVTPAPEVNKPKQKKKPRFSIPFLSPKKAGNLQKPPQKLASGGISPGNSQGKQQIKQNLAVPYADTLKLQLQASGIAAVSVLGQFISGTGALGGFFAPYLKRIVNPFALALGVNQNIINTLLGGPVAAATLNLNEQQKYFGMMWGKFLNDPKFVDQFIDRETDPSDPNSPPGYVPANWKDDPEFTAELNRVAQKFQINANDLLAVMLVETGGTLDPSIRNPSGATGLIQFLFPESLGTTFDALAKMTRAQQMKYVEKYLDAWNLPKRATGGQIYASVFLPAYINKEVLTVKGEGAYDGNVGLDYNKDERITRSDLDAHVEAMKKHYKLARGGQMPSVAPTSLILGPKSGYPVSLDGGKTTAFTGHGYELISGDKVYPIDTPAYNLFVDKKKTFTRWAEIYYNKSFDFQSALKMVTSTSEVKKPEVKVNYIPGDNKPSPNISSSSSSSIIYDEYFDPHLFREESLLTRLR